MNPRAGIVIGGLVLLAAALTAGVVLAFSPGDGRDGFWHMRPVEDHHMGMMQAFGRMDTEQMLGMMRSILGEEDYDLMLDHMDEHRRGDPAQHRPEIDAMMHRMMDGMMEHLLTESHHRMPMMPRR